MRNLLPILLGGAVIFASPSVVEGKDRPEDVILKAIKAHGGKEKLARSLVCHYRSKGTLFVGNRQTSVVDECWMNGPNQTRDFITLTHEKDSLALVRVFDGKRGWQQEGGTVRDLTPEEVRKEQSSAYALRVKRLFPLLEDNGIRLSSLPSIKVDGREAVGVKVSADGEPTIELYFDSESHLLVKIVYQFGGDRKPEEHFFSDYRDIQGLKVAMKRAIFVDGKKMLEDATTTYELLDKIDPKLFAKPE